MEEIVFQRNKKSGGTRPAVHHTVLSTLVIKNCTIIAYSKYTFTLKIIVGNGKLEGDEIILKTGGDFDSIYRYDPFALEWEEHFGAEIRSLTWNGKKIKIVDDRTKFYFD